ncbi:Transcription accessory protein (S1 RNA-binding domain) [hydrothermal vent metagenome]|uniref:Transcription accessory protein (S1 RNA-binding domain) n=1 Tax=hydrothermal vent metagenome TaxID=652676 RepID=A0A3B0TMN8_9ZZZZ
MNNKYSQIISSELQIKNDQTASTISLLEDGSTIPFIARYRKEATGQLDEVVLTKIRDRYQQLMELDKRREAVLKSIQEQGKLSKELKVKIDSAKTLSVLEDIYLPYKPKRRTKATIAKEKGLEPLAKLIFAQKGIDPIKEAEKYVDVKKKVESLADALKGARDIMAEWISENQEVRSQMRKLFWDYGSMESKVLKGKEIEGIKFKDYFQWKEAVKSIPSHRVLAVRRGEKEKILSLRISPVEEKALEIVSKCIVKGKGCDSQEVSLACEDSYRRLISLSIETETRLELKKNADIEAIKIFNENLRELLMEAPLGQKNILAIDPGFRTGCKVVCLNRQGKLLENQTIFPGQSKQKEEQAVQIIQLLCETHKVEVIAIGNGTASRETDQFIRALNLGNDIQIVMVNESGASIYSASEAARKEFPDYDITVRGAVSIGRRLMDPLSELVKIDPKSIGVGQYQYDVDQRKLKSNLDDVVISCVNSVGVEVNTASQQLLSYVSGVGTNLACKIVEHRDQQGGFTSRDELKKVAGFGPKVFEQAAGFLRICDGVQILDASAVHPESYHIVQSMAQDLTCELGDLIHSDDLRKKINLSKYVTDLIGMPTLIDIKDELAKPGRDPREAFELFQFAEGIKDIKDLESGMELTGVVTNVTAFGAFVDVGVHHDGLVHISQLSERFVKDPHAIVKVHQKLKVKVLEVDIARGRIGLTARV